jgi:hypothetical protein
VDVAGQDRGRDARHEDTQFLIDLVTPYQVCTALVRVMVDTASANSCPSIYPRDQRDPLAIHPPKVLIITLYLLLFPLSPTPPIVAPRRDYRPATPKPAYLHRACTTRVAPSKLTSTFTCRTRACTCTALKVVAVFCDLTSSLTHHTTVSNMAHTAAAQDSPHEVSKRPKGMPRQLRKQCEQSKKTP